MIHLPDFEHAMIKYTKTFEEYKNEKLGLEKFSDGWIFITMLKTATNFKINFKDLNENSDKWSLKLGNLKKVVSSIQDYFQYQINKGIKATDISLIEIAKNNNPHEIIKLFELVIAVMTEAPNKEDHINTIMSLDERSQSTFVEIIQSILESRILQKNQSKQQKFYSLLPNLEIENGLLRQEVQSLLHQNFELEKECDELKLKYSDIEEELTKVRGEDIDRQASHNEPKQKQHLRNMVENLKDKLLCTVRESEVKAASMKEEIIALEAKLGKYEDIEEEFEQLKKKYTETIESYGKVKMWERQKNRLNKCIQDKDQIIRRLNLKLDEANETNYHMQEQQLYTKMELEKRDVRFKELEKEVKKRIENSGPTSFSSDLNETELSNSNFAKLSQQINEIDQQEIEQLRAEMEKLKKKLKESERENNRMKRNIEKVSTIESDKKKLEKLILDVNNQKKQQVELLLSTTFDFYVQNLRLKEIITSNKLTF